MFAQFLNEIKPDMQAFIANCYPNERHLPYEESVNSGLCFGIALYLHLMAQKHGLDSTIYFSSYHLFIKSKGRVVDVFNPEGNLPHEVSFPDSWADHKDHLDDRIVSIKDSFYKGKPCEPKHTWGYFYNAPYYAVFIRHLLLRQGVEIPAFLNRLCEPRNFKGNSRVRHRHFIYKINRFINSLEG